MKLLPKVCSIKFRSKQSIVLVLISTGFTTKFTGTDLTMSIMAVRVVEFSNGGYKIRKVFV